jgi:hypothetical protein
MWLWWSRQPSREAGFAGTPGIEDGGGDHHVAEERCPDKGQEAFAPTPDRGAVNRPRQAEMLRSEVISMASFS